MEREHLTAYDALFRHVATRIDAERAHHVAVRGLRTVTPALAARGQRVRERAPAVEAMGLTFHGRLGLAAGFDKNAVAIDGFAALGFSFVEIGTVTGEPQPGNPRPRLFRLPEDRAVVNRMGFNNDGAEAVARRLARWRTRHPTPGIVLGVNIGKTKAVPESDAVSDYEKSARLLAPHADYLVVNVSSPNTPGLRDLQSVERLGPLVDAVRRSADTAAGRHVPLLVKIAPDLADDDVLAVADLAREHGLDGLVATNTTTSRAGLRSDDEVVTAAGAGGLSGAPVRERADEVVRLLRGRVGPELTLIGVGGILTPSEARERLESGATLLQAYTGLVYGGPAWPARVQRGLGGSPVAAPVASPVVAPVPGSPSSSSAQEGRA